MKIDLSHFREAFLAESADHVATMEAGLLELRSNPTDVETLNSIFRAAHSIKGGAGSFGFTNLVAFTHSLENLLDRMRSSEVEATEEVIAVLLRSIDVVRDLLQADPQANLPSEAVELEKQLGRFASDASAVPEPKVPIELPASSEPGEKLYRVEFRPDRELFASGTNPLLLLRNLAALGTISCSHLHADELPPLTELDTSSCFLSWTIELASLHSESDIKEVFEFVEHLAEIKISNAEMPAVAASADQGPATTVPVAEVGTKSKRKASKAKTKSPKPEASGEASSIRVAIEKVDRLIDLVGELVIAHVMTAQMVENFEPSCLSKLKDSVAAMERNTRELHERVMSIRMLPVSMVFHRYPRVVYDIAQSTGKLIRLETSGEETEIDRSMLEALSDPLVHLVRNAADHGIETPDMRRASGKPEEGIISLKAFHRAGRIVIEISDDGAGIDVDRVRQKAVERGLIEPDAQLSDDQVRMLIFEPGFSTRDQISDLSGRGVGMDVVKRNIQAMNGTVSIASEKNHGSTMTIELPLTLAILEGLLVGVAERTLVVPLLSVIETVPLPEEQITRVAECGEVVVLREESIPLLRLSRFLHLPQSTNTEPSRKLAVIVEAGKRKIGLVVDELLGKQQVVVKSLERHLRKVDGLMGATILGDGSVAPIVDVGGLAGADLFGLHLNVATSTNILRSDFSTMKSSVRA